MVGHSRHLGQGPSILDQTNKTFALQCSMYGCRSLGRTRCPEGPPARNPGRTPFYIERLILASVVNYSGLQAALYSNLSWSHVMSTPHSTQWGREDIESFGSQRNKKHQISVMR